MKLDEELLQLWTDRRTRLLNNEKVYAQEGDYIRALRAKLEAEAVLAAMEDVQRILQRRSYLDRGVEKSD